ncbi:MAG: hypothetical protein NTW28_28595 [Candidatus Solibacter sp.]|nr:hypothetical protein [Candidatus Solibacter sp.]
MAASVGFKFATHDSWPDMDLYWDDGGMRPPAPREFDEDYRMLASRLLFIGDKGKILHGNCSVSRRAWGSRNESSPIG